MIRSGQPLCAVLGMAIGLLLGWWIWSPAPPATEGRAVAERLPSGALLVERDPTAQAPQTVQQAVREAGGTLERAVSVQVRPKPVQVAPDVATVADSLIVEHGSARQRPAPQNEAAKINNPCECEPVTVDIGIVRMPDQTRRVVATSTYGDVLGAVDIPFDMPASGRTLRWAAGLTMAHTTTGRREFGAFVDRDAGPLRLGLELQQRQEGGAVVAKVGLRF